MSVLESISSMLPRGGGYEQIGGDRGRGGGGIQMQSLVNPFTPSGPSEEFYDGGFRYLASAGDADAALRDLYAYWQGRGTACLLATSVRMLVQVAFIIAVTVFLAFCIDWQALVTCDHEDCAQAKLASSHGWQNMTTVRVFFLLFICVHAVEFFWRLHHLVRREYPRWQEVKAFYWDALRISEDDITFGSFEWSQVADVLHSWMGEDSGHRFADGGILDELKMTQTIMRLDNYLIALVNKNKVDMNNPGRVLLYVLQLGLRMSFKGSQEFVGKRDTLRAFFVLWSVFVLVGMPFILTRLLCDAFFRYGFVMRKEPGLLAAGRWSGGSLWRFREFNELPHVFEHRMSNSSHLARNFVTRYASPFAGIVGRLVIFVTGGLAGTLFVLSLLNDSALVFLTFGGKSLIWWLSILTVVVMSAHAMIQTPTEESVHMFNPRREFSAIAGWTHWYPEHWQSAGKPGGTELHEVVREFGSDHFQSTVWWLFWELIAVLATPYRLFFVYAGQAEDIVTSMDDMTVQVPGVGSTPMWATFPFKQCGDASYGCPFDRTKAGDWERANQGKLEKSFVSFYVQHYRFWPRDGPDSDMHRQVARALLPERKQTGVHHPDWQACGSVSMIPSPQDAEADPERPAGGGIQNPRPRLDESILMESSVFPQMVARTTNADLMTMSMHQVCEGHREREIADARAHRARHRRP